MHGDGRLPRPKLTLSNHQGVISLRLHVINDFINYKVTRIKTFVKYLDNVNFPNNVNPHAEPDPDVSFSEDIFFVNEKTREDDNIVEFELVSLLELQNANVPARTVYSNMCPWMYRGDIGCGYKGKPISDDKNKRFIPSGYHASVNKEGNMQDISMVGSEVYFSGEFRNKEFAPSTQGGGASSSPTYADWSPTSTYNKGDVVKMVPFDHSSSLNPIDIYVCLQNNVQSNPVYATQDWALDDCSRTICGCRLRFSDAATGAGGGHRIDSSPKSKDGFWTESEEGLPFGGFPGVDPYDFK